MCIRRVQEAKRDTNTFPPRISHRNTQPIIQSGTQPYYSSVFFTCLLTPRHKSTAFALPSRTTKRRLKKGDRQMYAFYRYFAAETRRVGCHCMFMPLPNILYHTGGIIFFFVLNASHYHLCLVVYMKSLSMDIRSRQRCRRHRLTDSCTD